MLHVRLCPRCGCSHGSKEGEPYTTTAVCVVCVTAIRDAIEKPPPPAAPKPSSKPAGRKRGKR